MKRWYCSKPALVIGLLLVSFSSFSAQTIYGLDQARQFKSKNAAHDFYIQLGSYKNKSYALRAKSQAKKKANSPVLLKQKNGYYLILLGPFHSATEVRATAQKFGSTESPVVVIPTKMRIHDAASTEFKKAPAVFVYKDKDGVLPLNHWFIGAGGGWMVPFETDSTNFASSGMPEFPDDRYFSNTNSNGAGQVSGFVGYQWRRETLWLPATSLSFEYAYTFPVNIEGNIFVNNLPDTKNFTYNYNISQQLPMAKLKLDLYQWRQFMPYVSGGLGVALNRVYNYSDSPIPGATVMHRRYGFNSTTITQFTGSFGLGLDYWFNYSSQLSVGYELAYYGKARTGNGQGTLSNNHLENKFNSNAILVKGTYFFN